MANLNKNFQCESINELLNFDIGITTLFQAAMSRWNYDPSFSEDEYKSFEIVLSTQLEAQKELATRIKTLLPNFDFDHRHDILD